MSHKLGTLQQIISGGQTGVDRAALDFAIEHDIPHGGWCPKGRKSEDGPLEPKYRVTETPSASYPSEPSGMFGIRMAVLSFQSRRH